MKRILAIDLGDARIGISASDLLQMIAGESHVYNRKNNEEDFAYIAKLCTEKCVEKIVIGMPYNMDGSEGFRAQKTYDFAEKLRGYIGDIPIVFEDERLTTVEAEKLLIQSGVRRENRKKVIDKVAAAIILQNYLDRQN